MKVTASTLVGTYTPVRTPYAMRCVIARVLPVPAPASTHTGPRSDRDVALVGVEGVEDLVGGAVGERA